MAERFTTIKQEREALLEAPEHHELLPEETTHAEQRSSPSETNSSEKLQAARETVQETAEATHQTDALKRLEATEKASGTPHQLPINQELKRITLQRELRQVQRQLSAPEHILSRTIHQPLVRRVSEISGESLTRPSGLLGGGLVAFLGSSAYLYLAKHIGFNYNYGVFWLLLIVGFVFGVILETFIWFLIARRKPQA